VLAPERGPAATAAERTYRHPPTTPPALETGDDQTRTETRTEGRTRGRTEGRTEAVLRAADPGGMQ